jgi:hypothetical protein
MVTVKTLLVVATTFFALSLGGGMLAAAPILVSLHWLAAWRAGPFEVALWAFLAGLSAGEAIWMAVFALSGVVVLGPICGALAFLVVSWWMLASHAPPVGHEP